MESSLSTYILRTTLTITFGVAALALLGGAICSEETPVAPTPEEPVKHAGFCQEERTDSSGVTIYHASMTYDDARRATRKEEDIALGGAIDGEIDAVTFYSYDGAGRLVRAEWDGTSLGSLAAEAPDGIPDGSTTYFYDQAGRMVAAEHDLNGDGLIQTRDVFTYDEDGLLTIEAQDVDLDDTPESLKHHIYDAAGNRIRTEYDIDADGEIDGATTISYDAAGNPALEVTTWTDLKTATNRVLHTYDAAGNQLTRVDDLDGDGDADLISTFYYDCFD